MYLIIKHGFDNMENRDPEYTEIIGFVEDETTAEKWINNTMNNTKQYKGWDGKMYPYYEYKFIKKLM